MLAVTKILLCLSVVWVAVSGQYLSSFSAPVARSSYSLKPVVPPLPVASRQAEVGPMPLPQGVSANPASGVVDWGLSVAQDVVARVIAFVVNIFYMVLPTRIFFGVVPKGIIQLWQRRQSGARGY